MTGPRIVGAPDLVIEASSPATRVRDLVRKRRLYEANGVREYWFIDTDLRTQTVWSRENRTYVEVPLANGQAHSIVLPDLTIDVAALFAAADR